MRALAITAVAVGLALAGCGGGRESDRGDEPVLPAAVGENLAARAATVARQLEAGDTCAAAHAADRLNDALRRAIADGDVPERLRVEIQPPVERLVNEVNCEEAPPPEEPEEEAGASCDELEAEKKRLDEEKEALKESVEDEEERKTREQEIEAEKKRLEEQLKACGEGDGEGDGEDD
jgi:vacuolar-type H+-ATPase subunit I/STV1